MNWIETVIKTTSEGVEIVSGALIENGINGFQIDDEFEMMNFLQDNQTHWDYADESLLNKEKGDAFVTFYVTEDGAGQETLSAIRHALVQLKEGEFGVPLGELSLTVKQVDDTDWLNNWKKYYKPFTVGNHIVIKPIWETYEPKAGETVFDINPGHVFGTGQHQSTQLCIEELEQRIERGVDVLDLGCGSGILSIIALLLGAKQAMAVDIDHSAVEIAYENAANNGISKDSYTVLTGNVLSDDTFLDKVAEKKYDVVVANIIADVIIALAPITNRMIKQNGTFICSGIIKERLEEVVNALETNGFLIQNKRIKDEWAAVSATFVGE